MRKTVLALTVFVLFFIVTISIRFVSHSEVVWEDDTRPNGITIDQWKDFKDPCMEELDNETGGNLSKFPKAQVEYMLRDCVSKKIGVTFLKKKARGGWHPRTSQTRDGKPYVEPWDPKNPRKFNAYQYGLGSYRTSCDGKCDEFENGYYGGNYSRKEDCLISQAQCEERIENHVCTYRFWVYGVENCYPDFYWDWDKDKVYQWLLPDALMGSGNRVVGCLRPFAEYLNNCKACSHLIRCKKVCDIDYTSLSFNSPVSSVAACKKECQAIFNKTVQYMSRRVSRKCPGEFYP